ncbi:MAG: hypothetical protein LH468_07915, partial [Nocardioides sp.]|nr:hypothetical protein [Nocardioides sp.]
MHLTLTTDAADFLAGAREHLAADPLLSTVVATVAERTVADAADGVRAPAQDWWATIHDAGQVVGVAMRTAPFAPRPAYVLPMPDEAARLLTRTLHERGEDLEAVNGALPAVRVLLQETARLSGGTVEVQQHMRLFELDRLVAPRPAPGRLRPARPHEVGLVGAWFEAFAGDAEEQAGRERGGGGGGGGGPPPPPPAAGGGAPPTPGRPVGP